jgi:pyridoxine 5'-phosphate synthase PdxJ
VIWRSLLNAPPMGFYATATPETAGATGITVHPRADRRHITPEDVRAIALGLRGRTPPVEYNIEGDPRPELLDLVDEVRPNQCTLVPVVPGEVTSQAGWRPGPETGRLPETIARLHAAGVRVSLFVDPSADAIRWAASTGADRIELYRAVRRRSSRATRPAANRSTRMPRQPLAPASGSASTPANRPCQPDRFPPSAESTRSRSVRDHVARPLSALHRRRRVSPAARRADSAAI